jgi:hypothetical protein
MLMSDYSAIIAKIDSVIEIPNANSIQLAKVLGESVIVNKSSTIGEIGVLFIADTQLSHEYAHNNNLYRDKEMNKDKEKSGFFDVNRRVRAQPFLKVKSEAYFAPLESLSFVGKHSLKLGDRFESLNGVDICKKYINPRTKIQAVQKKKTKVKDAPYFNKHVDTQQFRHYAHTIPVGSTLYFHSKRHGTSFRASHTLVERDPATIKEKIIHFFTKKKISEWMFLTGTRNVTLYPDQVKDGFHGSEQFRYDVTEALKPYLSKGMTIYGEIVGYANGKPIMSVQDVTKLQNKAFTKKYGKEITYKYGCTEGASRFHVYRISMTGMDGIERDFSDKQCREWCESRNIEYAMEVHPSVIYDGNAEKLFSVVDKLTEREECLCESFEDPSHISEGIIIRIEDGGLIPTFLKSKSYPFRVLEGIAKEAEPDMEEES